MLIKPLFKPVIVHHLTWVRLRVVWDPRCFASCIDISGKIVFSINQASGFMSTGWQWPAYCREEPMLDLGRFIGGRVELSQVAVCPRWSASTPSR